MDHNYYSYMACKNSNGNLKLNDVNLIDHFDKVELKGARKGFRRKQVAKAEDNFKTSSELL